MDRHDSCSPHSLTPFELALIAIRKEVYPVVQAPPLEGIANVVASLIPVYEYGPDAGTRPRRLSPADLRGGLFSRSGRELHFLDGRPPKSALAIHVDDVQCVVAMLKEPERASASRTRGFGF